MVLFNKKSGLRCLKISAFTELRICNYYYITNMVLNYIITYNIMDV